MKLSFRKSFRAGPFRTTLSNRGLTNSVGVGGLRLSSGGQGRKKASPLLLFFGSLIACLAIFL